MPEAKPRPRTKVKTDDNAKNYEKSPKQRQKYIYCSLYDARVLATLGKIIVVTFNYRIGVLGNNNQLHQYQSAKDIIRIKYNILIFVLIHHFKKK